MKPALAILRKELMAGPRRKRFYLKRSVFVALGGIVILWGLWMSGATQSTTAGLQVFMSLAMSTLAAMCIISTVTASAAIMREKEERTIGLLFLSEISSRRFIVGKFFTALVSTAMTILSVLPMFMLAVSLGGVSAQQILTAFAVIVSVVLFGTCLGLFVASAVNTEKNMNGLLFLVWLCVFVLVPIAVGISYIPKNRPPSAELMCAISPFAAMRYLIRGRYLLYGLLNCAVLVIVGLPLLWLASIILPRRVVSREKPSLYGTIKEKMKSRRGIRKWVVPSGISGNPVAWKDFQFWHGGARSTVLKFLVSTVLVALIVVIAMLKTGPYNRGEIPRTTLFVVFVFSVAIFWMGCVSHLGMCFNKERKGRALEILLSTGLSDREIILGKIWGAMLSVMPWLICSAVCGILIAARFGDEKHFGEGAVAFLAEASSLWFGYSALALWLSLRYRKNVAFGVCILLVMLWNTIGRMILYTLLESLISDGSDIVMLDFMVHTVLGTVCLLLVFTRFRSTALRDLA